MNAPLVPYRKVFFSSCAQSSSVQWEAELSVKRALKMLHKLAQLISVEDTVCLMNLEMPQVISSKGPVYSPLYRFNLKVIKALWVCFM